MANKHHKTISVQTFGKYGTFNVQIPSSSLVVAKDVLTAMGEQIKLKENSYRHFALHVGELGTPKFKLDNRESMSGLESSSLCLQRIGGQETSKEIKSLKSDDVAVHLLYSEALYHYEKNPSKLQPTFEQKQLLDEYSDPSFVSERQFLEVALSVKGYTAIQVDNCTLGCEVNHRQTTIHANTPVICTCYEEEFQIEDTLNQIIITWEWKDIKRWQKIEDNKAEIMVLVQQGNAVILHRLILITDQVQYLLQGALEICTNLLYKIKPESKPLPEVPTREKIDPKKEFFNEIFRNSPRFSSLEPPKK